MAKLAVAKAVILRVKAMVRKVMLKLVINPTHKTLWKVLLKRLWLVLQVTNSRIDTVVLEQQFASR